MIYPCPCAQIFFNIHNCKRITIYLFILLLFPPFPYFSLSPSGVPITNPNTRSTRGFWIVLLQNAVWNDRSVLTQGCPECLLLLELRDHIFDFSLQALRTHIAWRQYTKHWLNIGQETWGHKHSLWTCHDGFFFVKTSKWMFRSIPSVCQKDFLTFQCAVRNLNISPTETLACRISLTPRTSVLAWLAHYVQMCKGFYCCLTGYM